MACTNHVPAAATTRAIAGESTAGRITLPTTPSSSEPSPTQLTPENPRPAIAAPIRPPKSACEELDGSPSSQVSMFHRMPPTRPASTMTNSGTPPSTSSSGRGAPSSAWILTTALVTVSATCTDKNAPTRLSTADSATAVLGRRAPVAMDVAIALAVSWNPFVKSNASAVATTSTRMTISGVTSPL